MRKLLLIITGCVLICLSSKRWGGTRWEDAKIIAVEKVYTQISEFMFPQLHMYKNKTVGFVYQDVESVFMPVVSEFRSNTSSNNPMSGNYNTSGNPNASGNSTWEDDTTIYQPTEEEMPVNQQVIGDGVMSHETPESSKSEKMESVRTKQVEINRTKLQEFDFLRQNFYQVDNTTTIGSEQLSVEKLLGKSMRLSEHVQGPQILIYHTHSQEAYADSAPNDVNTSVVALGAELARLLKERYGIETLHHAGQYDVINRQNAYANALPEIEQILSAYPSIEVVIDLHRDGVPESTRLVTEVNGKPTAQIMFFNGLSRTTSQGELAYLPNPYLEDNLAFSFQMQLAAAEYYPGFARRIYLKGYRYNMHLLPKSMLVEVGAQNNTFAEAKNAMEPLAELLSMVLLSTKEGN